VSVAVGNIHCFLKNRREKQNIMPVGFATGITFFVTAAVKTALNPI
jgi:hypothetical protein